MISTFLVELHIDDILGVLLLVGVEFISDKTCIEKIRWKSHDDWFINGGYISSFFFFQALKEEEEENRVIDVSKSSFCKLKNVMYKNVLFGKLEKFYKTFLCIFVYVYYI